MALIQDLCDNALRNIDVVQPGETPSSDERNTALLALNMLVGSWNDAFQKALAGSFLGSFYTFNPLNAGNAYALTDNAPTDMGLQRALVLSLTLEVAPQFGAEANAVALIAPLAEKAKAAILTFPTPVI